MTEYPGEDAFVVLADMQKKLTVAAMALRQSCIGRMTDDMVTAVLAAADKLEETAAHLHGVTNTWSNEVRLNRLARRQRDADKRDWRPT